MEGIKFPINPGEFFSLNSQQFIETNVYENDDVKRYVQRFIKENIPRDYRYCCEKCHKRDVCDDRCPLAIERIECLESCTFLCTNQRIKRKVFAKTVIGMSPIHGLGVFSDKDITEGDYVCEFLGTVRRGFDVTNNYCIEIDNIEVTIDPTVIGNEAKFFNHSCSPNMCLETWVGNDNLVHSIFVAIHDIPKGTELTYFYEDNAFKNGTCNCGQPACKFQVSTHEKESGDESPYF